MDVSTGVREGLISPWRQITVHGVGSIPRASTMGGAVRNALLAALPLICAPVFASWDPDQVWSWDKVPNTDGYRIYWSDSPSGPWSQCQSAVVLEEDCPEGDRCEINIPEPEGDMVFFVVTALNTAGESTTQHGPTEECP